MLNDINAGLFFKVEFGIEDNHGAYASVDFYTMINKNYKKIFSGGWGA